MASRAGNRFDDPEGVFGVLYFGSSLEVCFGETLAKLRPSPKLIALIGDEWQKLGFMEVGAVAAEWRHRNLAVRVKLPHESRLLDLEEPHTLQFLRHELATGLAALGHDELDVATVRGPDRRVTRMISRWAAVQTDEHGDTLYAGIRYFSRLNRDWECWAVFGDVDLEVVETRPITKDMTELRQVAKLYDLTVH